MVNRRQLNLSRDLRTRPFVTAWLNFAGCYRRGSIAGMNHFAHLVLAQPTVESTVGNLLGDFARGVDAEALPPPVRAGLLNHRAVDRFTDSHPLISEMKLGFSRRRRRFAGIALDIYFDHLLMNHWEQFAAEV